MIVAHKGFVWIEIEVEGRAAHGSRHEEGVDAIVKAGPILTGIGRSTRRSAPPRTRCSAAARSTPR